MLKHVHQICHVILHFFWWDPSAANKSPHLRLFNTHYFMPGAKSLISLIHFLFSTHYFFNYQKVQSSYASTLLLLLKIICFLQVI